MTIRICLALCFLLYSSLVAHARADEPTATSPDEELAARSLGGPWAETGTGIALTASTPLVWGVLAFALGPPLFECGWDDAEESQDRCYRDHAAKERQANQTATLFAVPIGLVGVGLIAHGAFRVARIRRARARLLAHLPELEPDVHVGPGQFGVGIRLALR